MLLLNTRLDTSQVYGAGLVLDDRGHVATSLQLVANSFSLVALAYEPSRAQGRDLAELIYENRAALLPAQLIRGDAETDLALVRIDGDRRGLRPLPFASEPPSDGAVALGHLDEFAWSNVVVSPGAAGGWGLGSPLLDARGDVVALGVEGKAQPIARVRALLSETMAPARIDLSTPERGFASCAHALQLGSSDYLRCMDWESRGRVIRAAFLLDAERRGLSREQLLELSPRLAQLEPQLLESQRQIALTQLRGGEGELALRLRESSRAIRPFFKRVQEMDPLELRYRLDLATRGEGDAQVRVSATGMPLKDWARLGLKVEAFAQPRPDVAALLVSSVDAKGQPFRFSQLLLRRGGKWLQCEFPSPEELALLPADWPKPLSDLQGMLTYLFELEDAEASR